MCRPCLLNMPSPEKSLESRIIDEILIYQQNMNSRQPFAKVTMNSILSYKQSRVSSRQKSSERPSRTQNSRISRTDIEEVIRLNKQIETLRKEATESRRSQVKRSLLQKENRQLKDKIDKIDKQREVEYTLLKFFNGVFAKLTNSNSRPMTSRQEVLEQACMIVQLLSDSDIQVGVQKSEALFDSLQSPCSFKFQE